MASVLVLLLLLFFFMLFTLEEATHTTTENNIPLGSWLSPEGENTSWPSRSGHFSFGFYRQGGGFAVGIWLASSSENTTTVVWTANRDDPAVSSESMLNLTKQGLLLQKGKGDSPNNIDSEDSESVYMAYMLDSGNFVLYDEDSYVVWQSFDHPTDTILGGQNMTNEDGLISSKSKSDHSSGCFYLNMQNDGNLVAYPLFNRYSDLDAYWASNSWNLTYRPYQLSLNIQGFLCLDGSEANSGDRLCLYDINKNRKKSHNNTTSIYRATFDIDGNLRLYEHQFHFEQGTNTTTTTSSHLEMLWQAMNDTCQVKGLCGLNSYCTSNMSGDAVCKCYPGFIPSKTKSVPIDCVQTHSKDDCESSEDRTLLYNFTHFENMHWGGVPYSVIPMMMKMEACEKDCRQDCGCGGAIYTNGSCNKYRLPLIYGRFQNDSSSTGSVALLKTPSTISIISPPTSNNTNMPKPKVIIDKKKNLIMILSLTLGVVSLICLVIAASIFFTYRRQVNIWVYQCFASGQLNKLTTHDEKDVDWKILERMVKVGLWCVQDQQFLRPTMKNVILMLEGLKDIPVPPSPARLLE
ncbi:hypothetical protein P8452_72205 [Trifolium repens]|nr:hypothetical protein P8452_72205 [Trifolium repens]